MLYVLLCLALPRLQLLFLLGLELVALVLVHSYYHVAHEHHVGEDGGCRAGVGCVAFSFGG